MSFLYVLEKVRHAAPWLAAIFSFLTDFGGEAAFLVVSLFLLWCVDKREGFYVLSVGFLGTVVNLLLFAVMVCLPISGIVLSKHLYTWLPTDGLSAIARTVHLLLSYWGFVLMSFHLGLHADLWLNRLKKREAAFILLTIALTLIASFGVYAFVANRLYEYMFLQTQFVFFDFDKPLILTFAEYLSMIVLFAWIGYWLKALLKRIRKG